MQTPVIREGQMPRLVNVKLDLKLPGLVGIQGTWEPDESEVRAAWELYVELVTRTPLGEILVSGGFDPGIAQLYLLLVRHHKGDPTKLWPIGRQPQSEGGDSRSGISPCRCLTWCCAPCFPSGTLGMLAWERTNPDASEWEWQDRREFLDDLDMRSREQLEQYAGLFAEVAGVPELLTERTDATDMSA